jgi:hypothetical protein
MTIAPRVPLRWVCATIPRDDAYVTLDTLDSEEQLQKLRSTALEGLPIWLELALPDHTELDGGEWAEAVRDWFQGSLDAWVSMDVPVVDWRTVAPVLGAIGLAAPATPTDRSAPFECRFLDALPHLYGRGIARMASELDGRGGELKDTSLFPTVGFIPDEPYEQERSSIEDPARRTPGFWTVRAGVATIGETVVTVRLPDVRCSGKSGGRGDGWEYRSGARRLRVRLRYLPLVRHATQHDIAQGIAIYQAATLRAVAEEIRGPLRMIERRSSEFAPQGVTDGMMTASEALERVMTLTETTHQIDRQVSSLLRRLGGYGEDDDYLVPRDIKLRYRFGLDDIRSLRDDCRLARDAVSERISSLDQASREQFQVIAAVLGSAILVPGLVAAIYSTDVKLPAENSWGGFAMLLFFILGSAGLGLWAVTQVQSSDRVPRLGHRLRRLTPRLALLSLLFGVAVAVVWGIAT